MKYDREMILQARRREENQGKKISCFVPDISRFALSCYFQLCDVQLPLVYANTNHSASSVQFLLWDSKEMLGTPTNTIIYILFFFYLVLMQLLRPKVQFVSFFRQRHYQLGGATVFIALSSLSNGPFLVLKVTSEYQH